MKFSFAPALFVLGVVAVCCACPQPVASTPPVTVAPAYGGVPYALLGQPGGFSQADAKRVIELLESIDKRLENLEAKGGLARPPTSAKLDVLPIAQAKCAACHTPAKADAKGGGFSLFADEEATRLSNLKAFERRAVKQAVQDLSMPKNGKLTPAERAAFDW